MRAASALRLAAPCLLGLLLPACSEPRPAGVPAPDAGGRPAAVDLEAALVGPWRGVLESPGGELPFRFEIVRGDDGLEGWIANGDERAPFTSVALGGERVVLAVEWYDSRVAATLRPASGVMAGEWTRTNHGGAVTRMPFRASRGGHPRFGPPKDPVDEPAIDDVSGVWSAVFVDEDGSEPARVELRREGRRVLGTVLTPMGDYRFLEGAYEDGVLRLSTFDGAHAFLFTARVRPDGSLAGDFHSRDVYHATWTAERAAESAAILPDSWTEVGLANAEGRLAFTFPDLEGEPVSLADERFAGKAVVVNLFGSWCPNCNDEAPLLADRHRRYGDRGLEIVGLAYELTGEPERDREFVRRYAERHAVEYPLLLAGTSDKAAASATLPDLTGVAAFPTTIFVDRTGEVARIHTGFAGPGTGEHHARLVAEMEAVIEELLGAS